MSKKTRVLIVEDDDIFRELMVYFLERAGFDVLNAAGGTDAFTQFLQHRPDILVSDIIMPNGNGIELAKKVMASENPIPVFLMSGYTSDKNIHDLESSPYWVGVFEKPFSEANLVQQIKLVSQDVLSGKFQRKIHKPLLESQLD